MIKALLALFIILMIPNIIVYFYHSHHEFEEAFEHIGTSNLDHKGHEQLAEGIFFLVIAVGYTITTILVAVKPKSLASYYIILIGTIVIIVVYYFSKTVGFPAPDFYDYIIIDDTTNWKDAVTKIAQQTFVIPLAMLLMYRILEKKERKPIPE